MSLTNPSTNPSEPSVTPGPIEMDSSSSARPMVVRVSLATMKRQLLAQRKALVKRRRNELAAAAKARKTGDQVGQWENLAKGTLAHIRKIDARVGLLDEAQNERSWNFEVDLRDPGLRELGFGMDDNGNYPAL